MKDKSVGSSSAAIVRYTISVPDSRVNNDAPPAPNFGITIRLLLFQKRVILASDIPMVLLALIVIGSFDWTRRVHPFLGQLAVEMIRLVEVTLTTG